jgi:hypothetical protein
MRAPGRAYIGSQGSSNKLPLCLKQSPRGQESKMKMLGEDLSLSWLLVGAGEFSHAWLEAASLPPLSCSVFPVCLCTFTAHKDTGH